MRLPIITQAGNWLDVVDLNVEGYENGDMLVIRFHRIIGPRDYFLPETESGAVIISSDVLARLLSLRFPARGPFGAPLETSVLLMDDEQMDKFRALRASKEWGIS